MRFSAALQQIARLAQAPAAPPAEPARAAQHANPQQAAPKLPPELPVDLDQRVRLIGEW
jgi:hypothetical protein